MVWSRSVADQDQATKVPRAALAGRLLVGEHDGQLLRAASVEQAAALHQEQRTGAAEQHRAGLDRERRAVSDEHGAVERVEVLAIEGGVLVDHELLARDFGQMNGDALVERGAPFGIRFAAGARAPGSPTGPWPASEPPAARRAGTTATAVAPAAPVTTGTRGSRRHEIAPASSLVHERKSRVSKSARARLGGMARGITTRFSRPA